MPFVTERNEKPESLFPLSLPRWGNSLSSEKIIRLSPQSIKSLRHQDSGVLDLALLPLVGEGGTAPRGREKSHITFINLSLTRV